MGSLPTPEILESLTCAQSTNVKHISQKPITFSCGHSACKNCLPSTTNYRIKCLICGETNTTNLFISKESHATKSLFTVSLEQLFHWLQEELDGSVRKLKTSSFEKILNEQMEAIVQQIDVRIKDLKDQLDALKNNFVERLDSIRNYLIETKPIPIGLDETILEYDRKLIKLVDLNRDKKEKTEDLFFDYQSILFDVQSTADSLIKLDYELTFNPSLYKPDMTTIGFLDFSNIAEMQSYIDNITEQNNRLKFEANILNTEEFKELIQLCEFPLRTKKKLIYKGSINGFRAEDFHEKCDDIRDTLVLIKTTNDSIFGGYTNETWTDENSNYKEDPKAFIFSFNKRAKFNVIQPKYAVYSNSNYGPVFGRYHDICIYDRSNYNSYSFSRFPDTYESKGIGESEYYLNSGTRNFRIKEIEVFYLVFDS